MDDELIQKLYHWWDSEDGWLTGDRNGGAIDHTPNWEKIFEKIRELGYLVCTQEEFNKYKIY